MYVYICSQITAASDWPLLFCTLGILFSISSLPWYEVITSYILEITMIHVDYCYTFLCLIEVAMEPYVIIMQTVRLTLKCFKTS